MPTPAITVENLSKVYRLGVKDETPDTIAGAFIGALRSPLKNWRRLRDLARFQPDDDSPDALWALRDVSFEVPEGEVLGVIGRNGAGKSTLLKILSRITEPTHGRAVIRGRVSSLLEVGTGFHPELTGRENIYMNGTILGMRKREIDRKFDEIVDFSGVEKFLDTPIKRYSSGMNVRLAFAVAAHLEPEILIIDEVLAVGDSEFQKKCMGKMQDVAAGGRTVLFVSHNMPAVSNLCSRCVVMNHGGVETKASTSEAIAAYSELCAGRHSHSGDLRIHEGRTSGSIPSMTNIRFSSAATHDAPVTMGDRLYITLDFALEAPLDDINFGLIVKNHFQVPVFGINNIYCPSSPMEHPTRNASIIGEVPQLPLMPGTYSVDLYFGTGGTNFDVIHDATSFSVEPADVFGTGKLPPTMCGSVYCPATWRFANSYPSEALNGNARVH